MITFSKRIHYTRALTYYLCRLGNSMKENPIFHAMLKVTWKEWKVLFENYLFLPRHGSTILLLWTRQKKKLWSLFSIICSRWKWIAFL